MATTSNEAPPVGSTTNVYNRTTNKPNRAAFWVIGILIIAAIAVMFVSRDRAVNAVNYSNPTAAPVVTENATGSAAGTMNDANGTAAGDANSTQDVDKTPVK